MYVGIGATKLPKPPAAVNVKLPVPSVVIVCPLEPPVIFTLPTAPRLLTPVTERFVPDILPEDASSVIDPVVIPFFTTKFFVVTVPYSLYNKLSNEI
jgi:hypothetical protein